MDKRWCKKIIKNINTKKVNNIKNVPLGFVGSMLLFIDSFCG